MNLTKQFIDLIEGYSPIDPIPVNWSVYRREANGSNPNARQIKVFAQPAIKTTQQ